MRRLKGFTLVELLVVISIIALMMAILLPALSKARETAKRVVCASNLKSIMAGNLVYSQMFDGTFAPIGSYDKATDGSGSWVLTNWPSNKVFMNILAKGKRSDAPTTVGSYAAPKSSVLYCPSDEITKNVYNAVQGVSWSYGYNGTEFVLPHGDITNPQQCWVNFPWPVRPYSIGQNAESLRRSSEKLAFVDGIDWWCAWPGANNTLKWDIVGQATIDVYRGSAPKVYGPTFYRHNQGANVAFYDGHASWMKKQEIFVMSDWNASCIQPGMWVVDLGLYRQWHGCNNP